MNTFGNAGVLNILLHYENAKKVSNRKISHFRGKMILYYYTKKSSLDKNGCKVRLTVDLIPSQDGQIRAARVLPGKSRNTVDRPVNRLYPLETNFKFVLKDSKQNRVQEVIKEGTCRFKRKAAELAKVRMRCAPDIT